MLWDKSSWPERVIVIWGLLIASSAVIYVAVSLSNLIFENSSNIADWVQALGSIGAILGVWWQTNRQLRENKELKKEEDFKRSVAVLKRSLFLIQQLQVSCENIRMQHADFLRQRKAKAEADSFYMTINMPTYGGDSSFLQADWGKYGSILSSALNNFSDLPYWDISDADLANEIISIRGLASVCLLTLDHSRKAFINLLDELSDKIAGVEDLLSNYLNAEQKHRQG